MRRNDSTADTAQKRRGILARPPVILFAALVGIGFGIFFLFFQNTYKPIPREQAEVVTGEFEKYEAADGYGGITLQDGTYCIVSADTAPADFESAMAALEKGTQLHILIHPRTRYVIEVRTDKAEFLNFDASQEAIRSKNSGGTALGIILCVAGLLLVPYAVASFKKQKRESERLAVQTDSASTAIRRMDTAQKGRMLLKADVAEYHICYRRVKFTNELAVNGVIYDELHAFLELEHRLFARLDGHLIEAGFDEKSGSYILFDGKIIKQKRRFL